MIDILRDRARNIVGAASAVPPTVAVAMANSPEVIACLAAATRQGLARFILVGPPGETAAMVAASGIAQGEACVEPAANAKEACATAAELAASGAAQVVMKGLAQTADFVRAILAAERLVDEGRILSHVALFQVPGYGRPFIVTDAALIPHPTPEQRLQIVANAAWCAVRLGIARPRIACIAPVETVSDKVPSTGDCAALVRRVREGALGDLSLEIDGPFGLDVALSPDAARIKRITGDVAGRADILLLPDLDAANTLYKSLTVLARAEVAGIVAGATTPVVLTSRADSEESKLESLRFALVIAGRSGERPA